MNRTLPPILILLLASVSAAAPVDFTRDVRPILSQHCFQCHGPDDHARKAGLRLDSRSAATAKAKSGTIPVAPGKLEQSEAWRRIVSDDADEVMPPPTTKKPLSAAQKDTLKRWIAEGAEYKDHWSFVAPKQVSVPPVTAGKWAKTPIDYFVLQRLEAAGLKPSPPADKYTLARRVSLDLIGLPPTPKEADAFVHDESANAYEKLVDGLLKSPHYGERWARPWLDLARYADTNGYEKDRQRVMWTYRDWVIRALNDDMPFDRFTVEQLAGDLLPAATLDQRIATGFHRNTMLNEEGGADPLEYRWHAMNDRVATTGTTWLGLTVNCCQCHNHKFDPITQKEYYQLFAFLNNCDEPSIDVTRGPDIAAKRTEIEAKAIARDADLAALFPPDPLAGAGDMRPSAVLRQQYLEARFAAWLATERSKAVRWTVLTPMAVKGNVPTLTMESDGIVFVGGDKSKHDEYDLSFRTDLKGITAVRLEVLPDDRLPNGGPGRVNYEGPFGDFFLCEFTLDKGGARQTWAGASGSFADGNNKAALAIDGDPQSGWSINGGQGKAHAAVFNLTRPLDGGDLNVLMLFEKYYAAGLGKFRVSATVDPKKAEARGLPADIEALVVRPEAELSPTERDRLRQHFLSIAPELKVERDAIQALRNSAPKYPTALVMAERPAHDPRPTYLHQRGEYTRPTDRVGPGVPAALPGIPKDAPLTRLTLAKWLIGPQNPLTARVTVNRQWAGFFGRGIVRTTEDFGLQGAPPTHPELLDWLAVEFVKQGWSLKKLHKQIVMSATYRQASNVTPEMWERDPKNDLLAHAPRLRLEAELVRDTALKVSGLLSAKVGGPSVFPPQPPGVTSEGTYGGLAWTVSPGEDRSRRGLYTFSKRTAPYAMFLTFDGPSGEACVSRREVSNTPLQALTLLNDAAFVEASQALGKQLAASPGKTEAKALDLWRRCLIRPPETAELGPVVKFFEKQKARLGAKGADPLAIAGPGEGDAVERAAWTVTARALLNLDEAVTKE